MRPGRNILNHGPYLGAGMPHRYSNGRRRFRRLSPPHSQSPARSTGSTAQRHSWAGCRNDRDDDAGLSHHLVYAVCPLG